MHSNCIVDKRGLNKAMATIATNATTTGEKVNNKMDMNISIDEGPPLRHNLIVRNQKMRMRTILKLKMKMKMLSIRMTKMHHIVEYLI